MFISIGLTPVTNRKYVELSLRVAVPPQHKGEQQTRNTSHSFLFQEHKEIIDEKIHNSWYLLVFGTARVLRIMKRPPHYMEASTLS
jgi:hypothetical protein